MWFHFTFSVNSDRFNNVSTTLGSMVEECNTEADTS